MYNVGKDMDDRRDHPKCLCKSAKHMVGTLPSFSNNARKLMDAKVKL